ncbi:hypothetical protein BDM02DRAFT_3115270 [Thelephora ganbajun]|uniref:Uncharacterized protein n=1 Tax=Thelephora ganbajun TaxID=370292 RepID=A0ACB6ZGG3_THEGA|nr:hypothetical protein BDM02DRAFT_3115270 [Thelephora ganbajun]
MDAFISLAKQGVDAYERSHSNPGLSEDKEDRITKTGGHEYNSPHHSSSSPNPHLFDEDEVVKKASSHGSGDSSLFSSALAHINSNRSKHEEPIDEEGVTGAHRKIYQEKSTSGMSASSLGSAAALEIVKQFTGGGHQDSKKPSSKTDLISLAMAEASNLFDKFGGSAHGNKQDAVNSAGLTIMKLLVQSKFSGAFGGGGSGGLGGLLSLDMTTVYGRVNLLHVFVSRRSVADIGWYGCAKQIAILVTIIDNYGNRRESRPYGVATPCIMRTDAWNIMCQRTFLGVVQ